MSGTSGAGRRRTTRLLGVVSALVLGAGLGLSAAPSPAAAIPPGGWCFNQWYNLENDHGQVHQQDGPTESMTNSSSIPITWRVSREDTQTFHSTTVTTTNFQVAIDFGVIKASVERNTTKTVVKTRTVTTRSEIEATIPPGMTMFAAYGVWVQHTSGTYFVVKSECGTSNIISETSGHIDVYAIVDPNPTQGWQTWDG